MAVGLCGHELPKGRRKWCSERCRKRQYLSGCVVCGKPCEGERCKKHQVERLVSARIEHRKRRDARILQLREEGLTNQDIATELRTSQVAISSAIHRMKQRGVKVPKSTYDPHNWNWTGSAYRVGKSA